MHETLLPKGMKKRFVVESAQGRYGILDRVKGLYTQIERRRKTAANYARMLNREYGYK